MMFRHIALQLLHLFLGGMLLHLRAAEPEAQSLGKHHLRYCQQQQYYFADCNKIFKNIVGKISRPTII